MMDQFPTKYHYKTSYKEVELLRDDISHGNVTYRLVKQEKGQHTRYQVASTWKL